jgi:tetratricopeptide (TPR) repeat protein
MKPRNIGIFKLASRLFKPQNTVLPTPYTYYFRQPPCQGSSNLAMHYKKRKDPNAIEGQDYLPAFDISAYKNRLASVKQDFDAFNIVEAQDSIVKIVNDLETMRIRYSNSINRILTILQDAYYYKGVCFSKGGLEDKEKAIAAFKKALEINPNHANSKSGLRDVELSFGIDSKGNPIAKKL